jgi:hypothetical protein
MTMTWRRVAATVTAIVLVAAGCAASTPPSSVPSPAASSAAAATPTAPTSPAVMPVTTKTPSPTDQPSPTPLPRAAVWGKPRLIRHGPCSGLSAAIDADGRYHVAVDCGGEIRYLTSGDGTDWTETSFVPPIHRLETDPQITLDGDKVYLANSLLAPTDGGCGDDGYQDVGVYTRSKGAANGSWSDPVRVGVKGDRVQSFRVAGGVLHLTVTSADEGGPLYYESRSGSDLVRVPIPHAVTTSLRVGDDGHARIAYATGGAIRYARVERAHLSTTTIASSTKTNLMSPSLVLGPGDHPYIAWTQNVDNGGGCAGIEAGPLDGVYVATDASGKWTSHRITRTPGQASLTLDPATGRTHVVVVKDSGLTDYQSIGGSVWTSAKIPGTATLTDPLIRLDPLTGSVNVFGNDYDSGILVVIAR